MCKSVKLQLLLVIKDDKEDRDSSLLCQEGEEPTRLAVINLIVVDHSQRPGDDITTYKYGFIWTDSLPSRQTRQPQLEQYMCSCTVEGQTPTSIISVKSENRFRTSRL